MNNARGRTGSAMRAIALGTLLVGTLDILDAFLFFGARGARPDRILQSIASGVLGPAAYEGGARTAALGVAFHFTIACGIVTTYYAASRRVPALRHRWLLWGPLYGICVYLVMNYVVIPLSAMTRGGSPTLPIIVNGILIHVFGVGIPAAWVSRQPEAGRETLTARAGV